MAKNSVPNVFTLGNLSCGIISLLMTFQGKYMWACFFILIAGILDRYDGRLARFLNVSSSLGKELDSLADLVSFGVAPSMLVCGNFNLLEYGIIGYILILIFPIAGAYRLARYNSTEFDGIFMGVPITAAGMFMAFYTLITILNKKTNSVLPILLTIMLSYLMVSKFKIKKV